MARRQRDALGEWIDLAVSTDSTRPTISKPWVNEDGELVGTDGHRIHLAFAGHGRQVVGDPGHPRDNRIFLKGFKRAANVKKFFREDLITLIHQTAHEQHHCHTIAILEDLRKQMDIVEQGNNINSRENLRILLRETGKHLKLYDTLNFPIRLDTILGQELGVNGSYLLDALSLDPHAKNIEVEIRCDGSLDPVFVNYANKYLAIVMPVRI